MKALNLLRRSTDRAILVLGDVMLDKFEWGRVRRISPEAPVPVVEIERESYRLGGAANVACNIRDLGANPKLVGVIGEDEAAATLREELAGYRIGAEQLCASSTRPTTMKTRIVASHQQVVRTDREVATPLPQAMETALIGTIQEVMSGCHAVVLSDYAKGVLTPKTIAATIEAARKLGLPVLVDPKGKHYRLFQRVTMVTPNLREAEHLTGLEIDSRSKLSEAAESIRNMLHCDAVLVTMGEHGMSLFEGGEEPCHIPASAREVFDVTGAGDTVIAVLAVALAAGAAMQDAAELANRAAGIVVGKLGTATVSLDELQRP